MPDYHRLLRTRPRSTREKPNLTTRLHCLEREVDGATLAGWIEKAAGRFRVIVAVRDRHLARAFIPAWSLRRNTIDAALAFRRELLLEHGFVATAEWCWGAAFCAEGHLAHERAG